jgi:dienelactone hydrolase
LPRPLTLLLAALLLSACAAAPAKAAAPDPLDRGQYAVTTLDPFRAGTVNLQEPNAAGGPTTGTAAAATLQIRGSLYYPAGRPDPAPLIVLVHGNHGSCDTGSAPDCTVFKRNDRGYAYLGENLASWGYAVASIDQDQLMYYQDGPQGKGMHQRRLLIAATLDALYDANAGTLVDGPDANLGNQLAGRLDFSHIGLMGHSRGGDAVASFIDYNRTRPAPGRRYELSGVISLAPVDYERRAPYGTAFMSILPYCDGDVSNLQGARLFERSQYVMPGDPFPRIQVSVHGTNHNWFNSVWSADGEDSNPNDVACAVSQPNNLRLSGGTSVLADSDPATPPGDEEGRSDGGTYTRVNRGSGDPALMGDQEKVGLALMASFFRRYVGGEEDFDEYMTGERGAAELTELPESACPSQQITGPSGTGTDGTRLACEERIMTSYFAPPDERVDVIRPETERPLSVTALGTSLTGSGFVSPYLPTGGVTPLPPATHGGYDWCNPEPTHFAPGQLGLTALPTATKPCPLPALGALGGQSATRENAPINQSYGLQLALAWDRVQTGAVAKLAAKIPPAAQDVSGLEALAMGAAVNFFDDRNPARSGAAQWNPSLTTQDFTIALTDADGVEGTVDAADQSYGNALHPTPGSTTSKVHVVLNQLRVPLADFAAQGVDLTSVRKLELRFGEIGKPGTGSIQLSDVRFQEATGDPEALADPGALIAATPRASASPRLPDAVALGGATRTRGCVDTAAPRLAITRVGGVLRGSASDRGCSGVRSVQVALAKRANGGGCRFVRPGGGLTAGLPCSRPLALVAKGTTRWSLRLGRKLPAGAYRVVVRALDASGNQTAVRRSLRIG